MNLMDKSMSFIVIGIAFMVSHCTASSVDGSCKTDVCYAGEYCQGFDCLPCKNGFYNSNPTHTDVSCKPWTQKIGAGWTVSKEGNRTTDIVWECAHGYEETNRSGITECRKIVTQPTPTSSSTSNPEKGNTTDSSKKIPTDSQEDYSDTIIMIVVPIAILIIILIVIIICLRKRIQQACTKSNEGGKNKKPSSNDSKNDHELNNLLKKGDADKNAKGSDSPSKPSDSSKNQNKKDDGASGQTDNQNKNPPIKPSGPDAKGRDPKNQNKNDDNGSGQTFIQIHNTPGNDKGIDATNISLNNSKKPSKNGDGAKTVLKMKDQPVHPVGEDILDTSMSETVLRENSKTSNLLNALEEMFKSLCIKLGVTDGNKVMDGLKLKRDNSSLGYTLKFTKCLLEWISSAKNDGEILNLIDKLIKLLKNIERNDIVHDFSKISEGVTEIILQDALEEMFENLSGKLEETDGNKVMEELKLKPVDTGLHYKQKFVKCLLEWNSSAKNDAEVSGLLGQVKSVLEKIDKKDIVHHFDKIMEGVTRIIGYRDKLSKLPDEAGRAIQ